MPLITQREEETNCSDVRAESETVMTASCGFPLRIGLLMDHPSAHMVGLLDALARRTDCTCEVIYLGSSAPERRWGSPLGRLPYKVLKGCAVLSGGIRVNPSLCRALRQVRADVWLVNTCYTSPSTFLAVWWLNHSKKTWAYMNEPPRLGSRFGSLLKRLVVRLLLRRAAGVIGMGKWAEGIYRGVVEAGRPLASVPYYVKLDGFFRLCPVQAADANREVRFLVCCRMIPLKALDVLLDACERLSRQDWKLTLIGDGPLRQGFEEAFKHRWTDGRVRFLGELPYDCREKGFAEQDVFVFPSRGDGWGMVVPEALAAGLPVISTNRVGAAQEFIQDSVNGFIVPANDVEALAGKMNWCLDNRAAIFQMRVAARESLGDYRPEVGAERLVKFLSTLSVARSNGAVAPERLIEDETPTWANLTTATTPYRRCRLLARNCAKHLAIQVSLRLSPRKSVSGHRIMVYHLVLAEDRRRFEEHIKFYKDHFKLSSLTELVHQSASAESDGIPRLTITFDDGFRLLMKDCLELLEKHSVKATFFVPTGFVELARNPLQAAQFSLRSHYYEKPLAPMNQPDLRRLVSLGHEIGSHGVSHVGVQAMSEVMALREMSESRAKIAEWTGVTPESYAYPYGEMRNSIGDPRAWLRTAGYRFAFTQRRGLVHASSDPMQLCREHAEGNWSVRDLRYFLLR